METTINIMAVNGMTAANDMTAVNGATAMGSTVPVRDRQLVIRVATAPRRFPAGAQLCPQLEQGPVASGQHRGSAGISAAARCFSFGTSLFDKPVYNRKIAQHCSGSRVARPPV